MINYTLQCDKNHRFESSFRSIADYEKLEKRHALDCPRCGSNKITRAPMAPAIAKGIHAKNIDTDNVKTMAEATATLEDIQKDIKEKFADVGDDFPEEARAIHRGDKTARRRYRGKSGIIGNASDAEAKALADEGLPIARLRVPKFDA